MKLEFRRISPSTLLVLACTFMVGLEYGCLAGDGSVVPVGEPRCRLDSVDARGDITVFAVGAYAGRPVDYQIDNSGHSATRIDIAVDHVATPVLLILGAYEPTVWHIGWTPGTEITAVFATGYHRQLIDGLEGSVPTLISTYENRGSCGHHHVAADNLRWLNPLSRRLFDRPVDQVYIVEDGAASIGEASSGAALISAGSDLALERYAASPTAGRPALDAAVRAGRLRRATEADLDAWAAFERANGAARDVPPVANPGQRSGLGRRPQLFNAYVVLQAQAFPNGLFGAHAAVFFVPNGVPMPSGDRGHSSVYDFNTMRCEGPGCLSAEE